MYISSLRIKWLFNYLVLELFKNLKTLENKGWRKFWNYNLVCKEVVTSKLIPYCLFFIPILNTIWTKGCAYAIS